jgi:hypothetical protein
MTRIAIAMGSVLALWNLAGCMKVDAQAPYYGGSWGRPEPSAVITPASPNNKADLVRENGELRDRLAWVENDNRKLAHKYNELTDDIAKARSKRDQYAAERDRYRSGASKGGNNE